MCECLDRGAMRRALQLCDSTLVLTQGGAQLRGDAEVEPTEALDSDAEEGEDEGDEDEDDTSTPFMHC